MTIAFQVAGENGRGVADRLAAAELEVVGPHVEPVAAKLRDSDLEGDPGAR